VLNYLKLSVMNTIEKYTLAEQVIEYTLKKGVQQVAVIISESRNNDIEIRDRQIDKLTESNRSSLTISLFADNKYSSNTTNRLKKEDLFKFIDEAVDATRFLAEDKFRSLPEPELYYKGGGITPDTFDKSIEAIDPKAKIDLANAVLEEAYKKDDRVISVSSFYSDSLSNNVMVTSNGFKGDSARTDITLYATVSAKSGSGRPSDYGYETAMFFNKLKKTDIGREALERTLRKLDPKKISSGKFTMIVENRVAGNLYNPFAAALSGASIYRKQSFLAGKTDKPVGSPLMTVLDDPFLPTGPGCRLFDEQGLAAVKRAVVEEGVLRNFYIDTYYGKKLNMIPTSGSSSNVVFKTGTRDMKAMVNSLKKGILVTGFIGGNCNGTTGDFSYGIEGYLIENGKILYPVNEMNISGNMNQLWFSLKEVGNDIIEGTFVRAPSMMFENIDFSGI
jgi:PmbA protein